MSNGRLLCMDICLNKKQKYPTATSTGSFAINSQRFLTVTKNTKSLEKKVHDNDSPAVAAAALPNRVPLEKLSSNKVWENLGMNLLQHLQSVICTEKGKTTGRERTHPNTRC